MAEEVKISIVTPSFNQARFIRNTIESVVSQKISAKVEYIVIDGGSRDGTIDILNEYNERIKWISGKDEGQSDAVNKGLALSSGEIIGWLNSDDIYYPGTLQKVLDYFNENPDRKWLYGQCKILNINGNKHPGNHPNWNNKQ